MINKKLFDYIKRSLERGQSQEKLTKALIHKGWSRNLIQSTIKQVLDGVELKYDLREVLKESSRTTFEKDRFSVLGDAKKNNSLNSAIPIIIISILIIILSALWMSNSVLNIFQQDNFDFGKEMGELFDPTGYERQDNLKEKTRIEVQKVELEDEEIEIDSKETDLEKLIAEVEDLQEEHDLVLEEEGIDNKDVDLDSVDDMTDEEILKELQEEEIKQYPLAQRYIYISPGGYCGWLSYERVTAVATNSICSQMGTVLNERIICDQEQPTIYLEIINGKKNNNTCQVHVFNEDERFQFYSLVNEFSEYVFLLENQ